MTQPSASPVSPTPSNAAPQQAAVRAPRSRLPNVGTTIFTVMSALAAEHDAVNLGQGFPDFDCDARLIDAVGQAMRNGANQYPPMAGAPALRQAISDKLATLYGHRYHPDTEITVTAGGTQALFSSILCCVQPGDEVIVLEPVYDSYLPAIELAGGIAICVPLTAPDYAVPFDALAAALSPRTRALIINTPHNPTGRIWHAGDAERLAQLLDGTDVLVISDEVYEHMVFDGQRHESVARHPALARRSFVASSFGKTYHVTGWKVGYVAAPAQLTAELRKVHQFEVFTVNTPMQSGIAAYMQDPRPYLELAAFYQRKRDMFRAALASTRFRLLPCEGTYFQCVDYSAISDLPEAEFAKWLTTEIGVAAIPLSAFYRGGKESGIVRFCFAKRDETLQRAFERLKKL
ncbi:MAG: pyridoxal phosphate-dependent aminotransferase [Janthinobacterium lividum]